RDPGALRKARRTVELRVGIGDRLETGPLDVVGDPSISSVPFYPHTAPPADLRALFRALRHEPPNPASEMACTPRDAYAGFRVTQYEPLLGMIVRDDRDA